MKILILALAIASFCYTESASASITSIQSQNKNEYFNLDGYLAEGKATVYSGHFHNKRTASGLKYLKTGYTAASMKLPLMSVLKVTNTRNNESIFVLVNDRGNFKKALVDLSSNAAKALGISSTANVIIEFDLEKTMEILADRRKLKQFGIAL